MVTFFHLFKLIGVQNKCMKCMILIFKGLSNGNHSFYKLLMRVSSFILLTILMSEKVNNQFLQHTQKEASVLLTDKSQGVPNYFVV